MLWKADAPRFALGPQGIVKGVDQASVSRRARVMQLVGDIGKGDVVFGVCEGHRAAGAWVSKGAFRGS